MGHHKLVKEDYATTRTSNRLALTVVILSSILLAMLLTGPHTPATVDAATTPTPDCTIGDTACIRTYLESLIIGDIDVDIRDNPAGRIDFSIGHRFPAIGTILNEDTGLRLETVYLVAEATGIDYSYVSDMVVDASNVTKKNSHTAAGCDTPGGNGCTLETTLTGADYDGWLFARLLVTVSEPRMLVVEGFTESVIRMPVLLQLKRRMQTFTANSEAQCGSLATGVRPGANDDYIRFAWMEPYGDSTNYSSSSVRILHGGGSGTARHCVGNRLPAGKVIYAYQRCRGSKCGYPSMLPSVNRRNIDRLFDSEENFREMVTFALAENNAGWYSIMRPEYGTWNQGDVTANLFYQSNDPIANRYLGSEAPVLFTACDGSGCRVPRAVRGDLLVETDANRNAYIPRP